jgi:hypothetical protein
LPIAFSTRLASDVDRSVLRDPVGLLEDLLALGRGQRRGGQGRGGAEQRHDQRHGKQRACAHPAHRPRCGVLCIHRPTPSVLDWGRIIGAA